MGECAHLYVNSDPCVQTCWRWESGDADKHLSTWKNISLNSNFISKSSAPSHHHVPHSQSTKERAGLHGNKLKILSSSVVEIQDNIIIKELLNRLSIVLITSYDTVHMYSLQVSVWAWFYESDLFCSRHFRLLCALTLLIWIPHTALQRWPLVFQSRETLKKIFVPVQNPLNRTASTVLCYFQ